MYLPIPNGVDLVSTKTASLPASECTPAYSSTKSASVKVLPSVSSREKKANTAFFERHAPIDGSWKQVRDSGQIKMTPMSIRNETTQHFVSGVHVPVYDWKWVGVAYTAKMVNGYCQNCTTAVQDLKAVYVQGRYYEQGDIDYWKEKYPSVPHLRILPELSPVKVEDAKAAVYSELFQAYNLGEELAEFRETISSITILTKEAVTLILKSRTLIQSLLKRGLKKEAANRWMEFRYGIMPIIYSIQDILALKSDIGCYRTTRQSVKPDEPQSFIHGSYPVYFYDEGVATIRCSVIAKARWSTQLLKQLDLININPITTAVEVFPWAMVIRWFFNVSTFVNSQIKSLTSLSLEDHACVVIREQMEYGTYLYYSNSYSISMRDSGDSGCGTGWYGVTDFGKLEDSVSSHSLLSWYSVNNYNRYLFKPSDVKLVFNPKFNWQRTIDAMILGGGQLSKSLRRLK